MKTKAISLLLCLALPLNLTPKAQASSTVEAGACIVLAVAVAAGAVKYLVRRCDKKWFCVHDNEDTDYPTSRKCIKTTKREMRLNNQTCKAGPFNTGAACADPCDAATNVTHSASATFVDEEEIPLTVIVQLSTNLLTWVNVATNYSAQVYFDSDFQAYEHPDTNAGPAFARVLVLEE